jgi:hypothetical protein
MSIWLIRGDVEVALMKTVRHAALVVLGLIPAAVTAAGTALAMPSGVGSAQDVVRMLEANGLKVILNPVSSARLDQCTVSAVRPGPVVAEEASDVTAGSPPHTTVYVDIKC